jgi:hypothetical protein
MEPPAGVGRKIDEMIRLDTQANSRFRAVRTGQHARIHDDAGGTRRDLA